MSARHSARDTNILKLQELLRKYLNQRKNIMFCAFVHVRFAIFFKLFTYFVYNSSTGQEASLVLHAEIKYFVSVSRALFMQIDHTSIY